MIETHEELLQSIAEGKERLARYVDMLDELYQAEVLTKAQWLRARRRCGR